MVLLKYYLTHNWWQVHIVVPDEPRQCWNVKSNQDTVCPGKRGCVYTPMHSYLGIHCFRRNSQCTAGTITKRICNKKEQTNLYFSTLVLLVITSVLGVLATRKCAM
jgi:hypothetical protein